MHSIYILRFWKGLTESVYIGQTSQNPQERWKQHERDKSNDTVHNAIRDAVALGIELHWDVLAVVDTQEEANDLEVHYIESFRAYRSEYPERGLNSTRGGKGAGVDDPLVAARISLTLKNLADRGGHPSQTARARFRVSVDNPMRDVRTRIKNTVTRDLNNARYAIDSEQHPEQVLISCDNLSFTIDKYKHGLARQTSSYSEYLANYKTVLGISDTTVGSDGSDMVYNREEIARIESFNRLANDLDTLAQYVQEAIDEYDDTKYEVFLSKMASRQNRPPESLRRVEDRAANDAVRHYRESKRIGQNYITGVNMMRMNRHMTGRSRELAERIRQGLN